MKSLFIFVACFLPLSAFAQIFDSRMTIVSLTNPAQISAGSVDVLSMVGILDPTTRVDLTCRSSKAILKIENKGVIKTYTAQDFYAHGCKALLSSFELMKTAEGGVLRVRFYGPRVYPGLIVGNAQVHLVYTPAGTGDVGTFQVDRSEQ